MSAVVLLTLIVSGCVTSRDEPAPSPAPSPLPRLDARIETPCRDPGVDVDMGVAAAENRAAYACADRKHREAVNAYNSARAKSAVQK